MCVDYIHEHWYGPPAAPYDSRSNMNAEFGDMVARLQDEKNPFDMLLVVIIIHHWGPSSQFPGDSDPYLWNHRTFFATSLFLQEMLCLLNDPAVQVDSTIFNDIAYQYQNATSTDGPGATWGTVAATTIIPWALHVLNHLRYLEVLEYYNQPLDTVRAGATLHAATGPVSDNSLFDSALQYWSQTLTLWSQHARRLTSTAISPLNISVNDMGHATMRYITLDRTFNSFPQELAHLQLLVNVHATINGQLRTFVFDLARCELLPWRAEYIIQEPGGPILEHFHWWHVWPVPVPVGTLPRRPSSPVHPFLPELQRVCRIVQGVDGRIIESYWVAGVMGPGLSALAQEERRRTIVPPTAQSTSRSARHHHLPFARLPFPHSTSAITLQTLPPPYHMIDNSPAMRGLHPIRARNLSPPPPYSSNPATPLFFTNELRGRSMYPVARRL